MVMTYWMTVASEAVAKYLPNLSLERSGVRKTTRDFQVKSVKIEVNTAMSAERTRATAKYRVRT